MEMFIYRLLYSAVAAGLMIIVIIIARPFLKRLPKWISLLLWLMVGIRLILPVSISSPLSLVPSAEMIGLADLSEKTSEPIAGSGPEYTEEGGVVSGRTAEDDLVNMVEPAEKTISAARSDIEGTANPTGKTGTTRKSSASGKNSTEIADTAGKNNKAGMTGPAKTVFMYIWAAGCTGVILYIVISLIILRKKIRFAIRVRDHELLKILQKEGKLHDTERCDEMPAVKTYICDEIDSPFVLGLFDQKMYIPAGMSPEKLKYVIRHENEHIRHLDPLLKIIAVMILAIYWFNPLVWAGFILFNRDIELACDERAVRRMDQNEKIAYSEALLYCGKFRRTISICSVAFGETGVRERVGSLLRYKKPSKIILTIAVICCLAFAGCFLTDANAAEFSDNTPKKEDTETLISGKKNGNDSKTGFNGYAGPADKKIITNEIPDMEADDEKESGDSASDGKTDDKTASTENTVIDKAEDETSLEDSMAAEITENDPVSEDTASNRKTENETSEEKNSELNQNIPDTQNTDNIVTVPNIEKTENEPIDSNNPTTVKNDNATAVNAIIPAGVKKIREKAFFFVLSIKTVEIPDSVTQIGKSAFSHCENLETVSVPEGIKTIPQGCFDGCYSLEKAYLPEGITDIDDYAFADCKNLQVITIPESVQEIEKHAFKGCSSLSDETVSRILKINPEAEF